MDQNTLILACLGAIVLLGLLVWFKARHADKWTRTTPRARSSTVVRRSSNETKFMTVFFNKTAQDRERIIAYWIKKKKCTREDAMKAAIEDLHLETRSWR
jgi:hypothetical protein